MLKRLLCNALATIVIAIVVPRAFNINRKNLDILFGWFKASGKPFGGLGNACELELERHKLLVIVCPMVFISSPAWLKLTK